MLAAVSDEIPTKPFETPDAWRGEDVRAAGQWWDEWTVAELAELDVALAACPADRLPASHDEFPLPGLIARIDAWMAEIDQGSTLGKVSELMRWEQLRKRDHGEG